MMMRLLSALLLAAIPSAAFAQPAEPVEDPRGPAWFNAQQLALAQRSAQPDWYALPGGALWRRITGDGSGLHPTANDAVRVHYEGTLTDGTKFDSSVDRGQPAQFALNAVIPGWTEGLQLMPVGSKYIMWIPAELGYGDRGTPGPIGPNATLKFEVELLEIVKAPSGK